MFFMRAVSLFSITHGAALAAPLVATPFFNSTKVPDFLPAASTNQRSTWDIFWSCLATIFACTWVSIHPNMPSPKDGRIRIGLQRLELMLWAVMTPEMIIFWAIRQWKRAREYATKYKKYGWTITHGHFLQMGGFVLADGDHDISVLTPSEFNQLLTRQEIGFPLITAAAGLFCEDAKYEAGSLDFAKSRVPIHRIGKIEVGKIQTTCLRILHPRQNSRAAAVYFREGDSRSEQMRWSVERFSRWADVMVYYSMYFAESPRPYNHRN